MIRPKKPLIKILTVLVNVMSFLEKRLIIKDTGNAQNENVRIKKIGSKIISNKPIPPLSSNMFQMIAEIHNNVNSYFISFTKSFIFLIYILSFHNQNQLIIPSLFNNIKNVSIFILCPCLELNENK